jgi:hypothetical protein
MAGGERKNKWQAFEIRLLAANFLRCRAMKSSWSQLGSCWVSEIYKRRTKKPSQPGLEKRNTSSRRKSETCALQANGSSVWLSIKKS